MNRIRTKRARVRTIKKTRAKRLRTIKKTRTKRTKKQKGGTNQECPVCYSEEDLCQMSPCNHSICATCFGKLKVNSPNVDSLCPLCRTPIQTLYFHGHVAWSSQINTHDLQTALQIVTDWIGPQWTQCAAKRTTKRTLATFCSKDRPTFGVNDIRKLQEELAPYHATVDLYQIRGEPATLMVKYLD